MLFWLKKNTIKTLNSFHSAVEPQPIKISQGICLPLYSMDSKDLVLIDDQTLKRIKETLVSKRQTLAVAESVTAGVMQTALVSAVDASTYFQGGITVYNLGQKARHLNVNPIHAESCNCVSSQVAEEMALNVCQLFASDWGIGVTGYATLDPVIKNKQPFAHFSIAWKGGS